MATQTQSRNPIGILIILAFVAGAIYLAYTINNHAATRHPDSGQAAIDCLNRNGAVGTFVDPERGFEAKICTEFKSGRAWWYIVIVTGASVVTAFCRERARSKGDVEHYLRDAGWRK